MFQRILLAYDFSPHAEVAKQIAQMLAQGEDKQLWALTVIGPLEGPFAEASEPPMVKTEAWQNALALSEKELEQERRSRLAQDIAELEDKEINVTPVVRWGDPAEEILAAAKEFGVDLIVMGSHSNRTFWEVVLGSVTEKVAKRAPCPLLIVSHRPPHSEMTRQRVLFATDFSFHAAVAYKVALSLAKEEKHHLYLLTVIPSAGEKELDLWVDSKAEAERKLQKLAAEARERGIQAGTMIRHGNPAKEINKAALDLDADLIVLGSHSRRNIWDVLLGNTAESVSRRAYCPVLIVSPPPGNHSHSGGQPGKA